MLYIRMDVVKAASVAAYCAYAYYNYVYVYSKKKINKRWKPRRWWMKGIHRKRTKQTMDSQFNELLLEPSGEFENFTRMSLSDFEYLLHKVSPYISKKDTQMREAIPAKVRLAITLRYLATGDSFKSLHYLFKVSSEVISRMVPEVCAALNEVLKDQIKMPSTGEEWLSVEKGFSGNFPHAIGAIDGKHIVMQCPTNTGSEYYNYKRTFSIVLLALVDSNYRFMFADIGSQGRISDGGVFRNSVLWQNICENKLNLPMPCPLPGSDIALPYVFLGDGAFALSTNLMKPYPGNHELGSEKRIFNETLSRSRVLVENTFGILASKFRVFQKPIALNPQKVSLITMTCILLHNFLKNSVSSKHIYTPLGTVDTYDENGILIQEGLWRQHIDDSCAIRPIQQVARRPTMNATQIREAFTSYFYNNMF